MTFFTCYCWSKTLPKKRQVDENNVAEFDASDKESGKYKVEAIWDSAGYAKESVGHLLELYYLFF